MKPCPTVAGIPCYMEQEGQAGSHSQGSGHGSGGQSPLLVLRHAHFRLIWIAAFGSYLGNWFEFVAVRWIVTEQAKSLTEQHVSAEDWMSYLSIAQLAPTFLLGLYGGVVADSVDRRRLLITTQFAMMLIALAMTAAAMTGHASRWTLLWLVLAQGIVVPFNMPAWQVLTPRLVPKNELTAAITLNGISFNVARTLGPAIAGVIMAIFKKPNETEGTSAGAAALLLFNALTFIGVMFAVLKTPEAPAPAESRGAWKHPEKVISRGVEALKWVWHNKGARAVMLAIVIYAVLATPVMPMMSVIVHDVHNGNEDTFGIFIAFMGIGAVTGGLAMKHVPKWYPMHHFIPASCLGGGVFILIFALANTKEWAMFMLFFVGVFWMWGFNSTAAAMQHLAPDAMRGRVLAVVNTIAMGAMPLGPLVAAKVGHLSDHLIGPWLQQAGIPLQPSQIGIAVPAALLIGAAIVMLTWRTPEVDGILPGQPGYDRRPGFWRGLFATMHRPGVTKEPDFADAAK